MLCRGQITSVTVFAPAKLNLFLEVLGKRADGYHELETLMVSVGLYDTLVLADEPSGVLRLSCRDGGPRRAGTPPREMPEAGPENLVWRAAELLKRTTGAPRGAQIELVKRIPLAAGLAGGSSDAAATLWGLNRLWNLGLSIAELKGLGARLGSDIPFFLCSTPAAICRGRGEAVEPLPLPGRFWFVIARPPSGLSTADVYRHCRPSSIGWSAGALAARLARGQLSAAAGLFYNALQEPAERLNADVTRLKAAFARQPFAGHVMSGSGTSYFGLCRSRRQGQQLGARLKAARLGDVFVVSSRP
ncbi:MAG: 4-(cytidine 5'-diphospho)-2-C-methyl-D-erythritol kinase [Deltaproteobacteria bacterium]